MSGLEAKHVTCAYGSSVVLRDLSLVALPGQVLALLGPNGAGKTTLLKALGRLLRPKDGEVLFEGRDVWRQSSMQAARQTAFTPQNETCDWPLTVEDVVLLGRSPHRGWLLPFTDEDRRVTDEALERLHLGPLRTRPVTQLSGGEWRRVMLARALAQQPRVLLLDEPTAQLDLKHQVELLAHLRTLAHRDQIVVIVTLHDLNQAAQYADQIALLAGGKLVAFGSSEEVLTAEILSETYGVPVQVITHPLYKIPLVVPLAMSSESDSRFGAAN